MNMSRQENEALGRKGQWLDFLFPFFVGDEECRWFKHLYQYSRTRRWRKFQKGKIYNAEEHVAIESFVTTLIHWTFFLMTRTKLAFVGFIAAGNSMWHQVLDDLCLVVTDQSATTCDSSFAPNSTQYNSVLQSTTPEGTTPVLQSTNPFLLRTTKYYKVLLRTTKY